MNALHLSGIWYEYSHKARPITGMEYQCQYICNCIFVTDDERLRHEKTCRHKIIGCCQSRSCCREIGDWLLVSNGTQHEQFTSMATCRHNSSGIFGAIKENNIDLVQYFLIELKDTLVKVLTHESKFGDTIITFACSLGRIEVVKLFMKTIQRVVHSERGRLTMSDLIDFQTSKGKTPLIEAVCPHLFGKQSLRNQCLSLDRTSWRH